MATLSAKITLTSTDLLSDSLSFSVDNSLTVTTGGLERTSLTATTSGAAVTLYAAASYAASSYIYLKNTDSTTTDYVHVRISSADQIRLKGGEWAWIPWEAAVDVTVYVTTSGTVLEHAIFA
tara:strand:+ start:311 stop:676 length:366 start_codon:yes stop_codon:yes gene_type:complete